MKEASFIDKVSYCCVVVPIYQTNLSDDEWLALRNNYEQLKDYEFIAVSPVGLDLSPITEQVVFGHIKYFDSSYFQSPQTYNKLLLSRGFWEQFILYDYMLIVQLDVIINRNELAHWCSLGYDYVGAPWLNGFGSNGLLTIQNIRVFFECSESSAVVIHSFLKKYGVIDQNDILMPSFWKQEIGLLESPLKKLSMTEFCAILDYIESYFQKFIGVGNGGLSLRNISKAREVLQSAKIPSSFSLSSSEIEQYPLMKHDLEHLRRLSVHISKLNTTIVKWLKKEYDWKEQIRDLINRLPDYSKENHFQIIEILAEIQREIKITGENKSASTLIDTFKPSLISIFLENIIMPEDFFWGEIAKLFIGDYCTAPVELALQFSFECNPEFCFEKNNRKLPFGCHAWQLPKHRKFWATHLELLQNNNGELEKEAPVYSVKSPLKIFIVSSSEAQLKQMVECVFENTHTFYEIIISDSFNIEWNYKDYIFCMNIQESFELNLLSQDGVVLLDDTARSQKMWYKELSGLYDFRIRTLLSVYLVEQISEDELYVILKSYLDKYYLNLPNSAVVRLLGLALKNKDEELVQDLIFLFGGTLQFCSGPLREILTNYKRPLVSIMIPVHNNFYYTKDCLEALWSYTNTPFELIIINNNSTDETFDYLEQVKRNFKIFSSFCKNVQVINNEENECFSKANNHAAKLSNGEFLLLLNNDTKVTNNWLTEMLRAVVNDSSIGAVGAKLLYEDGSIQHAGVGFGGVGWVEHLYRGVDRSFPYINIQHEYKSVTAACMLVRRSLFYEVSGLDENYINCYEDVDFCLQLAFKGYKNIVVPTAQVYHFESKTPGRNDNIKHSTEVFFSKWRRKMPESDAPQCYIKAGLEVKDVHRDGKIYRSFGYPNEGSIEILNKCIVLFKDEDYTSVFEELTRLFLLHRFGMPVTVYKLFSMTLSKLSYFQKAVFYEKL